MALTNNPDLARKMRLLSSHGITRNLEDMEVKKIPGYWYYEQLDLGFNYRMTDIQAALGISQMQRLDHFIAMRHQVADYYKSSIENLPLVSQSVNSDIFSSFHLYIVRLDIKNIRDNYDQVFNSLRNLDIGVNLHYIPVYLQPYYRGLGFENGYCPVAEEYSRECISIPIFPSLIKSDQDRVLDSLKAVLL